MVVKIRLARFGRTNSPFYNIVVAHARQDSPDPHPSATRRIQKRAHTLTAFTFSRTARNSKPLEVIGTYDPIPKKDSYDESGKLHKDIRLDVDRAKYWVGVGAQPTDTVWRFLSMVRTLPDKADISLHCGQFTDGLNPQLGILEPKYRPQAKNPPPPLQTDSSTTTSI